MRSIVRCMAIGAMIVILAGACSAADKPATGPASSATSTSTTRPVSTTTMQEASTVAPATGITLDRSGAVLHEIPDYGFAMFGPHVASTFAPASGWIVTHSPGEFGVWFPGIEAPDTLAIGEEVFEGSGGRDWGAGVDLTYTQGVNYVPIVVTRGTVSTSVSVPITYLPEATVELAKVTAVDETSITLDYGYWDSDGEFAFPSDDDVGVVETVPVDPHAYVILHETAVTDYAWFVDQYEQRTPHDDIGWYPNGESTVYWATIDDGHVVELWYIPVG